MKHPLLPDCYVDAGLHRTILSALAPYERHTRDKIAINNPVGKWDLQKAWDDAQPVLKNALWHYRGARDEDATIVEWEITAGNEVEKDRIYTLIAGVVARQILEPDSGYGLMRVVIRTGGEVGVFISGPMQQLLKADPEYPYARYEGLGAPAGGEGKGFALLRNALKRILKR